MTMTKRIVCLANSRKPSGRCIAGRELIDGFPGVWIRPVSARKHQEVSEDERQYEDGSDPKLLDIVDVPLLAHRPRDHQQENWLLDPDQRYYWSKIARWPWHDLQKLSETGGTLWCNGYHTNNGRNDQIPLQQAREETSSLKLIYVEKLALRVFAPGEAFEKPKRRVQGRFRFGDDAYALWITDPDIETAYLKRENGTYALSECYLTISLGEPYNDYCYKLIAAIMERPR